MSRLQSAFSISPYLSVCLSILCSISLAFLFLCSTPSGRASCFSIHFFFAFDGTFPAASCWYFALFLALWYTHCVAAPSETCNVLLQLRQLVFHTWMLSGQNASVGKCSQCGCKCFRSEYKSSELIKLEFDDIVYLRKNLRAVPLIMKLY